MDQRQTFLTKATSFQKFLHENSISMQLSKCHIGTTKMTQRWQAKCHTCGIQGLLLSNPAAKNWILLIKNVLFLVAIFLTQMLSLSMNALRLLSFFWNDGIIFYWQTTKASTVVIPRQKEILDTLYHFHYLLQQLCNNIINKRIKL